MAKHNARSGKSTSPKSASQTAASHRANMLNGNKGSTGQNSARAKNQGNRGKQLNPNSKP